MSIGPLLIVLVSVIGNKKKTFQNKQVDLFGKFIRKTVSLKVVLCFALGRGQTGVRILPPWEGGQKNFSF